MKVFTYHQELGEKSRYARESEEKLLSFWGNSWQKNGWEPIALNQSYAERHPNFGEWSKTFKAMPRLPAETEWQLSCLYRWISVLQAGGGMMVDYDVINYGFRPEHITSLDPGSMYIFADTPPGLFMGAVYGPKNRYEDIIQNFACQKTDCSLRVGDLNLIMRTYKNLPWLKVIPGCANYEWPSWKTSPLVHYHSGHRLTKPDQTDWIRELRKV